MAVLLTTVAEVAAKEDRVARGAIRRYAPVREVVVRVIVITGLRQHRYPTDEAVLDEALPDAPAIPGARGGYAHEIGRAFQRPDERSTETELASGLVPGSARWWERAQAADVYAATLQRVRGLSLSPERTVLLTRLLRLDPGDPEVNEMLGQDLYTVFLREGLSRSGISSRDEETTLRLAELYWNLQALTWRQELAEVAVGHSSTAEALYGALRALELAGRGGRETFEITRQLGALSRWNNDASTALAAHEALLARLAPDDPRRGQVLAEMAWDRIQWVAWYRRYDHPWVAQARREATEAQALARDPVDRLIAAQAMIS